MHPDISVYTFTCSNHGVYSWTYRSVYLDNLFNNHCPRSLLEFPRCSPAFKSSQEHPTGPPAFKSLPGVLQNFPWPPRSLPGKGWRSDTYDLLCKSYVYTEMYENLRKNKKDQRVQSNQAPSPWTT